MNTLPFTRSSIVSSIKSFTALKSLIEGKSIHAQIIRIGFLPEIQLYNHLINFYSKSFDFNSARKLLDEIPEPNLISYSTLISGYSQSNRPEHALSLVIHLHQQGILLNQYVFSSLLLSCSKLNCLKEGKQIHAQVIVSDFVSDPFVRTSLSDMYLKSGDLCSALSVFRLGGVVRDSVMYNSMLSGFLGCELYKEAVGFFVEARWEVDLNPSEFTLASVIKACSNLSLEIGEQMHAFGLKVGFDSNCIVGTSLVDMYGKLGNMESASNVFRDIQCVDRPLYNSMIVGFSNNGIYEAALEFFGKVIVAGFSPNEVTLSSVLKACGGLKCTSMVRIIHGLILKSELYRDLVVNTAMIDAYMKCGFVDEGCILFNLMSEHNVILYNSLIFGLGQSGDLDGVMRMFLDMIRKGIDPNNATFVSLMNSLVSYEPSIFVHVIKHGLTQDVMVQNALLDCLIKGGNVDEAYQIFNKMSEKNVISWTSLISGLSELGLEGHALMLFKQMKLEGVSPNSFTFSSVFKACANLADLEKGKCIHCCSIKHGIVNEEYTNSSLLDMYAKCGAMDESYKIFEIMPKNDVVSWNAMITAFSRHGKGHEALKLYQKMENNGVSPNKLTFTSLLSTCSHCGLIEEGVLIFDSITNKHNMVPLMEHYACMVDIFGRARMLEKARSLIESMPYKADKSIWMTFLAACKLHGDIEHAQFASGHLMTVEGRDNLTLVSLSNIYSEMGKWDDVERVRRRGKDVGFKKAGLSWVQIRD